MSLSFSEDLRWHRYKGRSVGKASTLGLQPSGAVSFTSNGQTIQGLHITSTSGNAVTNSGFTDCVLKECKIDFQNGHGVNIGGGSTNFTMTDLDMTRTNSTTGITPLGAENNCINGTGSTGLVGTRLRFRDSSTGVYLVGCAAPVFSFLEGYNFRGPFPRGQLLQYDTCNSGIVQDFYCSCDLTNSFPEDNINLYLSSDVIVRRGLIDGNNSSSGIGVIFEQFGGGVSGGLVEDVDVTHMGNGCFSAYSVGFDITFRRTRARDNWGNPSIYGRGNNLSNSLMWASGPGSTGNRILDSYYWNSVNGNIMWDSSTLAVPAEITQTNYTQRDPVILTMPWE